MVPFDQARREELRTVLSWVGTEVVIEHLPHLYPWIDEGHTFASIRRGTRSSRRGTAEEREVKSDSSEVPETI